jgi:hypothetical protein
VLPGIEQPMSLKQRVHPYLLHAAAHVKDNDYDLALPEIDRANDLAVKLGERERRAPISSTCAASPITAVRTSHSPSRAARPASR